MADEPNNHEPTDQNGTTAVTTQSAAPTVSLEDARKMAAEAAEAAVSKVRDSIWAEARRKYEKQPEAPKQTPKENAPQVAATGMTADEVATIVARETAFARAVTAHGLSPEAEGLLRVAIKAESPEDVIGWVSTKAKAFGITQNPNPTPSPSAPAPAATTAAPTAPAPSHPAPAATNPVAPPQSITDWNSDQLKAYIRSKGANPQNPYSPEYRKVARELRNRFLADTADLKLSGPK
jgi:hypothetical protein